MPITPPTPSLFQFTHPVRGATSWSSRVPIEAGFQFTHPVRGATGVTATPASKWRMFQFTHPVRGAT